MMHKVIIAVGVVLLLFFKNCSIDDKSRKDHKRTTKVCPGLYEEVFSTFGQGAFGADRYAAWLTDSVNFRFFLGPFDEMEGGFSYNCSNDAIYVTQRPDSIMDNPKQIPATTVYVISELKKGQNLDVGERTDLTSVIIMLLVISIGLNLYLGSLYMDLNRTGIISSYKRVSWKILKAALEKNEDVLNRRAILKCLNLYKIYLIVFYVMMILIIIQLSISAVV